MTGVLFAVFLFFQFQSFEFYAEAARKLTTGASSESAVVGELQGLIEVAIWNPGILLTVLGAIIAGAEFRTGQFGMSVVAVPNRVRLVFGKAIVTALYVLTLGLVWAVVGTALMLVSAEGVNAAAVLNDGFFAALARILLFMVTFALFPLGLTLITKRTLTGVISAMVLIMLTMSQIVAMVSPAIDAFLPLSAARNLLIEPDATPVPTTADPLHGGIVLTAWAVITIIAAAMVIKRRDAR